MTAGYVVDAGVVVKWLVDEVHSTDAAELLIGGSTFVAPAVVFAEAANALWAMHRRGHVGAGELTEAVETLRAAPISLPVPMLQLTPAAARLADDLDHPVHDCFYLALAVQTQYPVVTADMLFHDKVRAHPYLSDLIVHVADAAANGTAE